jgi:hypothetical protein
MQIHSVSCHNAHEMSLLVFFLILFGAIFSFPNNHAQMHGLSSQGSKAKTGGAFGFLQKIPWRNEDG